MSAPMINWFPAVRDVYRIFTAGSAPALQPIRIPSVEIHDVETAPDKRPRTLKHLLKANHANYAIFFHNLQFHNHMPHILGSAYLMGANTDQLHRIYEVEGKELEAWVDSPDEITEDDWRDFLGDRRYQQGYIDFFEDELAHKFGYDWKRVANEYLFLGKNPLINCVITGLGHPLIHLGYAYELSSRQIGMEALASIASSYNHFHKYIDDPSYTKPSKFTSTSPLDILHKIYEDERLEKHDPLNDDFLAAVFDEHEALILEYWNSWKIEDPVKQFRESQEAAVALLVSTVPSNTHAYDFFLCHILTTSHAVRILLPFVPEIFHISLVRQWWLLAIITYIGRARPKIDEELIGRPNLGGKQWSYVEDKAVNGRWATDAHYVKALRAIREAAMTWGDVHEWYLTAAVKFADEFEGWF